MKKINIFIFAILFGFLLAACSDDDETPAPAAPAPAAPTVIQTVLGASGQQVSLDGTWKLCFLFETIFVFSGSTLTSAVNSFSTLDCTGTATELLPAVAGTFTVGDSISVTLAGSTVTASKMDRTTSGVTVKDFAYVDDTQTPDLLYTGNDGAPKDSQGYPTELNAIPFIKQ